MQVQARCDELCQLLQSQDGTEGYREGQHICVIEKAKLGARCHLGDNISSSAAATTYTVCARLAGSSTHDRIRNAEACHSQIGRAFHYNFL